MSTTEVTKMEHRTCKHYRGTVALAENSAECDAGIAVRELVGGSDLGWGTRMPCFGGAGPNERANGPIACCDRYEAPTQAEIDATEEAIRKSIERTVLTIPLACQIKERFAEGDGGEGVDPCPVCDGKLHWSCSSYNHHVHAHCETEGCVSFME